MTEMNAVICSTGKELECARLLAARYDCLVVVPLTPKARVVGRDKKVEFTTVPALPSYVFAELPRTNWQAMLAACHGRRILTVGGELARIGSRELDRFTTKVATGAYANRLTRAVLAVQKILGQEVIIHSGIFGGQRATVLSLEGRYAKVSFKFGQTTAEHMVPLNFLVDSKLLSRPDFIELDGLKFNFEPQEVDPVPEDPKPLLMPTVKFPSNGGAPVFSVSNGYPKAEAAE